MIQIDMEKPSACWWADEEDNIHLCPFLDREFYCLMQGHVGYFTWDWQYKNCPLHEVIADPDTVSRQAVIECLEHLSACDEPFVEIGIADETFIGKYEAITEISDLPSAQPVDEAYLVDWYINSVDDSELVWTEEHILELMNDFYLIPRQER